MSGWVSTEDLEAYVAGDESKEVAAIEVILNIAQMVRYKHFALAPTSEQDDLVSEAFVVSFIKIKEDFVDFEKHSAFNYIYTHSRNAMQNYLTKRKEYREKRMGDLSETAETTLEAVSSNQIVPLSEVNLTPSPELIVAYNKIKVFYNALSPVPLSSIEDAILDGCDFDENKKLSPAGEALLVASFRSYMHISIRWEHNEK